MKYLIEHGANDIAGVFALTFKSEMRIERECFLGAAITNGQPAGGAMPTAPSPSGSTTRPPETVVQVRLIDNISPEPHRPKIIYGELRPYKISGQPVVQT